MSRPWIGHPDYVYQPWSDERRRKASEAAKRRFGQTRTTALVYGVAVPLEMAPAIRKAAYEAKRKNGGDFAAMKAIADMLAAALSRVK